jgi:hypothetical protein
MSFGLAGTVDCAQCVAGKYASALGAAYFFALCTLNFFCLINPSSFEPAPLRTNDAK